MKRPSLPNLAHIRPCQWVTFPVVNSRRVAIRLRFFAALVPSLRYRSAATGTTSLAVGWDIVPLPFVTAFR
jgi:hypothetical protein